MKILRLAKMLLTILVVAELCGGAALAQTTYSTGFESPEFTLGDVNGQQGWGHISNSPTKGVVETVPGGSPAPFGAQLLALRTRNVDFFGVANHLFSATIAPAGETGSTVGGVVVAGAHNRFTASFYYRTPSSPVTSTRADGRIAELNPSSKGAGAEDPANRYAQVRVANVNNTGNLRFEIGWYTSADVVVSLTGGGTTTVRGTTLEQPPAQTNAGGFNSSLSAGIVTLAAPLAPGATIDVQWLLGVQQTGAFRFYVNVEALP